MSIVWLYSTLVFHCGSSILADQIVIMKVYVRDREQAPFVSMAEMTKKFNSSTRDLSLPSSTSYVMRCLSHFI